MNIIRLLPVILLSAVMSCDKPLPTLDGIDGPRWQQDKNGCSGDRRTMETAMQKEKEKLLSLAPMQIVELLGRPDENELSSRNQKFFYYYLDPGPACTSADSAARKLSIRFNAVGLAKEVAIE